VLRHRHYLIEHPEDGLDSRSVGHFAERVRRKDLDSSRKTRNNSTGTEHALKTGTIGQQSNNNQPTKEPTFPRTRRKKQHIDEKKKQTTSRAEERHVFYPSPPQHGAVLQEISKQTLGLVASSFPFLFFVSRLSLFTFPRRTTKNIGHSVDPR